MIFEDFFQNYIKTKSIIKINNWANIKKNFKDLDKKIEEMNKSIVTKKSKTFISKCNENVEELKSIEETFDELFNSIKSEIEKQKNSLIKTKTSFEEMLEKIIDIKYKGSKQKNYKIEVQEIFIVFNDNLKPIDNFLGIENPFSYWTYKKKPKDEENTLFVYVKKEKYQIVSLENQLNLLKESLNRLKELLLENCGKYGEFYIALNEHLEEENSTEFTLIDIENSIKIKKALEELGESDISKILNEMSKWGLIKTKYFID